MIKHVVLFKFKEESKNQIYKAKEILLSMEGIVQTVQKVEVVIDELNSARSFDIMLTVTLDDFNALDEYQKDPYHASVVKTFMNDHTEKTVTMDYTVRNQQ